MAGMDSKMLKPKKYSCLSINGRDRKNSAVKELAFPSPSLPVRGFCVALGPSLNKKGPHPDTVEIMIETEANRALTAWVEPVPGGWNERSAPHAPEEIYLLGDGQDSGQAGNEFLGHGALLKIDTADKQIFLRTSLTGFPPIFIYQDSACTVIASSIDRIAAAPGIHLAFDPQGTVEFALIGKPIKHRTLFRNLSVAPAGVGLTVELAGGMRMVERWRPPRDAPFASWRDYSTAQEAALTAALHRMDLSQSFLSLTAGLDTRVIFALLCRDNRLLPAFTISGIADSLDARRAKELCDAHELKHTVVSLDDGFIRQFADCAIEASRRSGGLASFTQASEVFFYRALQNAYDARLSGMLGNQIGRSGTEGIGLRNVPLEVFDGDFIKIAKRLSNRHWFKEITDGADFSALYLIQQENLFASIANFGIGSSYTIQQTPYADRTVILQKLREPVLRDTSTSAAVVRLRDLKHRFLGDPIQISFQRQIVARAGGPVARSPINWGWRAAGGVSPGGLTLGMLALFDVLANTRLPKNCLAARIIARTRIAGLSGFEYQDLLQKRPVAEFVLDTLDSGTARCSPVIDQAVLRRARAKGFGGRSARKTLLFALDIVLAQRNFLTGA